jgi:predicted GNAT family N-acyltransferase
MFFRNDPKVVVATGSIVADDRDMGKKLNLEDSIWIGGVNVHREFRGKSFGKILIQYMDNYIQQIINKDTKIFLFTNNIYAKRIYKQFHFQSKGFIQGNSIEQYDQTVKHYSFLL